MSNSGEKPRRLFEKLKTWPGLFTLWKFNDELRATLQPELEERQNELLRRTHRESKSAERRNPAARLVKDALLRVEVAARTKELSFWSDAHATQVYSDLAESLGPLIETIRFSDKDGAEQAAKQCKQVFGHAIDGLIHDRFPREIDGVEPSGEIAPAVFLNAAFLANEPIGVRARAALQRLHALAAIEEAKSWCEEKRRLPRKWELRKRLELLGFTFSPKAKDIPGKWADVFVRAGLAGLRD